MKLIQNSTVAVLSLWRDSEKYLKKSLKQFEALEKVLNKKHVGICYGFFENDSKDKTPALLHSWLKSRIGFVLSENINAPKWGSVPSTERTKYQARYRNMALDLLKTYYHFDYLLVADSDVHWKPSLIVDMMETLEVSPGIGMITPNTTQNVPAVIENLPDDSYYDSWALRDMNSNQALTFASNPFLDHNERERWNQGKTIGVSSAFGSIAMVSSGVFNTQNEEDEVRWDGTDGCEHWHFCKQIRNLGYQIIVDPKLKASVVHETEVIPHPEAVEIGRKRLSNSLQYTFNSDLSKKPPISFGIPTNFSNKPFLTNLILSIRNQQIPDYEILLIGPEQSIEYQKCLCEYHTDIRFIPFDETQRPLWITKKKNILAQEAKYDRLILLHDYLTLSDDWYLNLRRFESVFGWSVLAFPQQRLDGGRFWYDWSGFDGPRAKDQRLFFPYLDWSQNHQVYISGNIFAVNKNLLLEHPLNEDLAHLDEEDLEWSNRLRSTVHFKCAYDCLVHHQKEHRDQPFFKTQDVLHSNE